MALDPRWLSGDVAAPPKWQVPHLQNAVLHVNLRSRIIGLNLTLACDAIRGMGWLSAGGVRYRSCATKHLVVLKNILTFSHSEWQVLRWQGWYYCAK